jgi:hypothetical protein
VINREHSLCRRCARMCPALMIKTLRVKKGGTSYRPLIADFRGRKSTDKVTDFSPVGQATTGRRIRRDNH